MRNNFFRSYDVGDAVYVCTERDVATGTVVSYSYSCNSFETRLIYAVMPDVGTNPLICDASRVFDNETDAVCAFAENRVN